MKTLLAIALLAILGLGALGGCEKNDYQHPMHRSTQGK